MPMIRFFLIFIFVAGLSACANKPPVQLMAEARDAMKAVQAIYGDDISKKKPAYAYYQSAEQSLLEASTALDMKNYDLAKQKARDAKHQARLAAKFK